MELTNCCWPQAISPTAHTLGCLMRDESIRAELAATKANREQAAGEIEESAE